MICCAMPGRSSVVLGATGPPQAPEKCPDHVRQLLGWVGSNPRLLVTALSVLSGQESSSPKDIFLGEILNPTCGGVPLIGGGLPQSDVLEMGEDDGATRTTSHSII